MSTIPQVQNDSDNRSIAAYKGYKDGRVEFYGNQVFNLTGYDKEELRRLKWTDLIVEEDRSVARAAFVKALKSDKVYTREYRIITKIGDVRWIREWSEILIDDQGEVDCVVGALSDFTQEKKLEEARNRAERLTGKYLIFSLAGEAFGLSILEVKEIIKLVSITPLPKAPESIAGVINLRGRVIPVVDLRLRLGLEPGDYGDGACIIVVELNGRGEKHVNGLLADGVSGVQFIQGGQIEPPPRHLGKSATDHILGLAKTETGLNILLNLASLFDPEEFSSLAESQPPAG